MFLVEDFVPDRIEFDLSADKEEIGPGELANVTVDGRYLYGAPAAGLALEGEVNLSTTREWERFSGYLFRPGGRAGRRRDPHPADRPAAGRRGRQGDLPGQVDQLPSTTRLLVADVTVRMRESGGRAVERSLDLDVRSHGDAIGIKPEFSGDEVPEGGTAGFKVIHVDPAGAKKERRPACSGRWSVVDRNYQWYRSGNYWNYEPITSTVAIANGKIDASVDGEGKISVAGRLGPLPARNRHRRPDRPSDQLRIRRRLVCRGDLDRNARWA